MKEAEEIIIVEKVSYIHGPDKFSIVKYLYHPIWSIYIKIILKTILQKQKKNPPYIC